MQHFVTIANRDNRPGFDLRYEEMLRPLPTRVELQARQNDLTPAERKLEVKKIIGRIVNQRSLDSAQMDIMRATHTYVNTTNTFDSITYKSQYFTKASKAEYKRALIEQAEAEEAAALENNQEGGAGEAGGALDLGGGGGGLGFAQPEMRRIQPNLGLPDRVEEPVEDQMEVIDKQKQLVDGFKLRSKVVNKQFGEQFFNDFVAQRDEFDPEAAAEGLRLVREGEEGDAEFFEFCAQEAFIKIKGLNLPTSLLPYLAEEAAADQKTAVEGENQISNYGEFLEAFKLFWETGINTVDDALNASAFALILLESNHFWEGIRYFLRNLKNQGFLNLTAKLLKEETPDAQSSRFRKELWISLSHDLIFSDYKTGAREINNLLYESYKDELVGLLGETSWSSKEILSQLVEIVEDMMYAVMVVNKAQPANEAQDDTGKEDMQEGGQPEAAENDGDDEIVYPRLYYRQDPEFVTFLARLLSQVLNTPYGNWGTRENIQSVYELLEEARETIEALHPVEPLEDSEPAEEAEAEGNEAEAEQKEGEEDKDGEEDEEEKDEDEFSNFNDYENDFDIHDLENEDEEFLEEADSESIWAIISSLIISLSSALKFQGNRYRSFGGQQTGTTLYKGFYKKFLKNSKILVQDFLEVLKNLSKDKDEDKEAENTEDDKAEKSTEFRNLWRFEQAYALISSSSPASQLLKQLKTLHIDSASPEEQIEYLQKIGSSGSTSGVQLQSILKKETYLKIIEDRIPILSNPRISGTLGQVMNFFFINRPKFELDFDPVAQFEQPGWLSWEEAYYKGLDLLITRFRDEDSNFKEVVDIFGKGFIPLVCSFLKDPSKIFEDIVFPRLSRDDFLDFRDLGGVTLKPVNLTDLDCINIIYEADLDADDFIQGDSSFKVHGADSIAINKIVKMTREELDEVEDYYNINKQFVFEDDDTEVQVDQQQANQMINAALDQEENAAEAGDGEDAPAQKFKVQKTTIYEIRNRRKPVLHQKILIDKLGHNLPMDMIRKGTAILAPAKHPRFAFENNANPGLNLNGGQNAQTNNSFFKKRIYGTYFPKKLGIGTEFNKLHLYTHHKFNIDKTTNNFQNRNNGRTSYSCLYVQRLKKVVMRCKTFSDFCKEAGYNKEAPLLVMDKLRIKDPVIDFDDPDQRDSVYDRIVKFERFYIKKNTKARELNPSKRVLKACRLRRLFGIYRDFTMRKYYSIKLKTHLTRSSLTGFDMEKRSNKKFILKAPDHNVKVVYDRGEDAEHTFYKAAGNRVEIGMHLVVKPSQLTYYNYNAKSVVEFVNDSEMNLSIWTRVKKSQVTSTASSNVFFDASTARIDFKAIENELDVGVSKQDLRRVKPCIYFSRSDGKKVYGVEVGEGDLKVAIHRSYRRVFILGLVEGKAQLRVISFRSLNKFIVNEEEKERDGEQAE